MSNRENPSVECFVDPSKDKNSKTALFFGNKQVLIPCYPTIEKAVAEHPKATTMVNFASFRSAYQSTMSAILCPNIK